MDPSRGDEGQGLSQLVSFVVGGDKQAFVQVATRHRIRVDWKQGIIWHTSRQSVFTPQSTNLVAKYRGTNDGPVNGMKALDDAAE